MVGMINFHCHSIASSAIIGWGGGYGIQFELVILSCLHKIFVYTLLLKREEKFCSYLVKLVKKL